MINQITTIEELKQIFSEAFFNNTDKVSKISKGSTMNGIAYGVSKIGQKILKDVAITESNIYPDIAVGDVLDKIASLRGIAPRLGQTNSFCYVRLVGEPGTEYLVNKNSFLGSGFEFELIQDVIIGESGFAYAKLKSIFKGAETNVDALTINNVSPIPTGHEYVINEYQAFGGRDYEDDDDFRKRIKDEVNVLSRGTISYLEQVFIKIEPDVLRVMNLGLDSSGDLLIGISSVNGIEFTDSQISNIYLKSEQYLSMNELKPNGTNSYGMKIVNIDYFPIDISFRVDLDSSFNYDLIRKNIQLSINAIFDHRNHTDGKWYDWIDILNSIKGVPGVKRVLDNYFFPNTQFQITLGKLPRLRGFVMMDLKGNIIEDLESKMNPFYYPNVNDLDYQSTVLKSL